MAARKEVEVKEVDTMNETCELMLSTARAYLKNNQNPSNELQLNTVKVANELVQTVASIRRLATIE